MTGLIIPALVGVALCLGAVAVVWISEGRPVLPAVTQSRPVERGE